MGRRSKVSYEGDVDQVTGAILASGCLKGARLPAAMTIATKGNAACVKRAKAALDNPKIKALMANLQGLCESRAPSDSLCNAIVRLL